MKNIRIEQVGDIHSHYNYLEVFYNEDPIPILEVGITEQRLLFFKIYSSNIDIILNLEEWEYIMTVAKKFLPIALKNEDDFHNSL